jgi:hypothetical protein
MGTSVGGLAAIEDRAETFCSFWNVEATGCATSAGGKGKTASEMAMPATYLTAGWDFIAEQGNGTQDIWCMSAVAGYPRLAWERAAGDFNADGEVDFRDYSRLAARWRQADTDLSSDGSYTAPDGVVDFDDLARFTEVWLAGR